MNAEDLLKQTKELFEKEGLNCSTTCYDPNKLQNKVVFYIFDKIENKTYKKFSVTIEDFSVDSNGNSLIK